MVLETLEQRLAKVLAGGATPLQDEVLAPLIRASPLLFAQLCLEGPPQAPFNRRLLFSPAHMAWETLMTTAKRYVLVASRGSGKSFITTYLLTLWRCATQPNCSGYIFSGTEFAAQRMLEEIKMEIERNPKLQWLYPGHQSRKWTATQFRTSNGHHVTAKGMMTRVRGAHPDTIILDDALTDEDAWSYSKRTKTIDYFYSTITNMILPGGQIGVVGTPFARQDLLDNLQRNPSYQAGVFPALDKNEQSTWPEVYTTEYLMGIRREIGSVRFARERQCTPVSDESSIFPKALFFQGDTMQPQARLGSPLEYWRSMGIEDVYIGVDFAFSASVSADYFAIFVCGVDGHQNRWLLDMHRERGVSFSAQKAHIVSFGRRYDPRIIHLESNAAQQVAADEIKRETDLPIRKFVTTAKRHSLEDGLPSLRILLENNKVRLPRGDARSVEVTDILIEEANNFTWVGGQAKSVGGHDDTVLSWFICEQAVRRGLRSSRLMTGSGMSSAPGSTLPNMSEPLSQPNSIPTPQKPQSGPSFPNLPTLPPAGTKKQHPGLMATGRGNQPQGNPGTQMQTVMRNGVYVRVEVP